VHPWEFLPYDYEPPLREQRFRIAWRSDLGPNVSAGQVGAYVRAFQSLLDLGDRWALAMAEEAAARSLIAELFAAAGQGEGLTPLSGSMPAGGDKRIYLSLQGILERRVGEHPETIVDVPAAIREVASLSVPDLLGAPLRTESISYQNPVEILLAAGAFLALGTVQVLRMVRDWGARRRAAEAAAEIAEAAARQARTRADVVEYLGREVIAGRLHVPPAQLGQLVTSTDLEAIAEILGHETTLELPTNVSELFRDTGNG
jgi:hypothetical protein